MENVIATEKHYDNLIDENNDPVHDSEELQEYMNKWDGIKFLNELKIGKDSSILEIGVGTGRLALKVLGQDCKDFVGVDLSLKTVNKARKNLQGFNNVELVVGDYLDIYFDKTFDIIYSSLTFFHIENKSKAIEKTWSLLNANGRFVLSIEKNSFEFLDYTKYRVKMFPDDLKQTTSLLEKCGFTVNNVFETEFAYIISAIK